jgi:hypothetical protein
MYKIIELEIDPELSGNTGVFEVAWVEYPAIKQELMYFSKYKFFKAPDYVSSKACQAIKENEKRGNPAGTQVGKVRAQQLCNQEEISLETIKRMKSFLSRAATYDTGNWDDNGTIAMGLWGGQESLTWVNKILDQQEEMGIQDFVYPTIGEPKDEFISRCIAYVINEGKTEDEASGQCYGMWENREFEEGVPHYTIDGKLYEGPTHKHNDRLMTGEVHTDDSEYLYHEGEFSPDKVSFDWDDTLDTRGGKMLLKQELQRGSLIYIISARSMTSKEMIDLANEYGFPASHIYTTGSNQEKVEKIKELGIKRHYDNNFRVIQDLDGVGIKFDYDVTGLPSYDNYPSSGDTDSMLIEPVLFSCGCDLHEEDFEWTEEDLLMKQEFTKLKENLTQEEFEAVTNPLLRGFTESEIYALNHPTPVTYFEYNRKLGGSPDRDFCTSIQGRWFRRAQIDALRDLNTQFGHNRQPYSKWLYKGGPNCVHAWYKSLFQGRNKADQGYAEGLAGQAPKELPNQGYYDSETKRRSEIAYIVSQQNMNSVSYTKSLDCFGDVCKVGFSKETNQMFATKTDQRMVYTPLMIPNILIPRFDEVSNEKYYVKFTPETILKIQQKFMIEQRTRATNYEHSDKKYSDAVMVESWIVEGEKDKSYELGFTQEQIPFGTWMGGYKILETPEGNEIWNELIKNGKVKGMSVEGNFLMNFSQVKTDEYLLEQIINILNQIID